MVDEEEAEIFPDRDGAYPVGYVPDGPLQRGVLYRTENNKLRMYPPGTTAHQQNKARKRWETERMEIYEKHKFEWVDAFLSREMLPEINDELKFNNWHQNYSRNKQAWLWVYYKFIEDRELIKKIDHDHNNKFSDSPFVFDCLYALHEMRKRHFP
jgi:hypothetical protein